MNSKGSSGLVRTRSRALAMVLSLLAAASPAQEPGAEAARPVPRWPDGRISFTGPPGVIGNWDGPVGASLAHDRIYDKLFPQTRNLPGNLDIENVPFQPWARKVYEERRANYGRDDPHTRCKPSGGPRMFHTPYGFEVLDLPDAKQIIFLSVGTPHSWRVVYMDGRAHPEDPEPAWYGHSTGRWEGDTLVIDTVGFNEKFWIVREGFPHTRKLHLVERLSRPDFNTLKYEATIDDPGAYTETWSGGWLIPWVDGNEPFDYLCQENNLDGKHMDAISD